MICESPNNSEAIFLGSEEAYRRSYIQQKDTWTDLPLPPYTYTWVTGVKRLAKERGIEPVVADLGSGAGRKALEISSKYGVKVTGIEYEQIAVNISRMRAGELDRSSKVSYQQGDLRYLSEKFGDNSFLGGFDYQAFPSIPSEFWPEVIKGYYKIIAPGGYLLMNLLSRGSRMQPDFHGKVGGRLQNDRWIIFEPDLNNPSHQTEACKKGMFIYYTDEREMAEAFSPYFKVLKAKSHMHPTKRRPLLTVLYESKK